MISATLVGDIETSAEFGQRIEQLSPPGHIHVMRIGDYTLAVPKEELAQHRVCSEKRRRELTTGRVCARAALRKAGSKAFSIVKGDRGEPVVAPPFRISISHSCEFAAAFATSTGYGIGIDIELISRVTDRLDDLISLPTERTAAIAALGPLRWRSAVFCAKESIYKATDRPLQRGLGFHNVELDFDGSGSFQAIDHNNQYLYNGFVVYFGEYVCALAWSQE